LISNFILVTINFIKFNPNEVSYHLSLSLTLTEVAFSFLAISLLFFPEILYGMPNSGIKRDPSLLNTKVETNKNSKNKKENEDFIDKDNPFNELAEQIKIYLDTEKPFLDPNFAISQIALDLNVPQNHVSYCINSIFKTKFTKLKTELRVEHAKTLLNNSKYSNLTIEGIAQMSGFGTRSNFYNAFKNETGLTPSDYLKNSEETPI